MLKVCLLGQFDVRADGRQITIPTRASQSLFAFLVLSAGTKHRREKLAGTFWADASDENARRNLRQELWRLRKALASEPGTGADPILADELAISFNADAEYWLDVRQLEPPANSNGTPGDLVSQLSLYNGELLPGFYDDWVVLERERAQAVFEAKMQQLLDLLIRERHWTGVLAWAEKWISRGQTPEPAYRALMLGYGALGDRAKVAASYKRCAEALEKELGVEPAPETQSLYDELTRGSQVANVNLSATQLAATHALALQDAPPAPGKPPFKGLQYFDISDANLYFGREQLTAKFVASLRESQFLLVVVGASGSGKSSLVRAGLIPALQKGEPLADGTLPPEGSKDWQFHVLTPTAHPLEALAAELTRTSESVTAAATLMDDLAKDPRSLQLFLQRIATDRGLPTADSGRAVDYSHALLVVDQFEELFCLCRDPLEREQFIDNLLYAVTQSSVPLLSVVITLRADFYAHLSLYPELRDSVSRNQEYIGPMTVEELGRAMQEPARRGEWEFESGLMDLILRDVGDEPGALPLLSHALLETWKRRNGRMMTVKGYAAAGGVRGAIAHTAETTWQQLSPEEQVIARSIFIRLTELGEATEDTRRRTSFAELVPQGSEGLATRAVLTELADARLITTGHDTAEVAHEALIREWPRLREWLNQDREGLRLHRQVTEAADQWELLERDPGALYRGARLSHAQEWVGMHTAELNVHERAFLEASQVQQESEQQEKEAQRQRELESAIQIAKGAQTLAAEQQARAEESNRANRKLRQRALFLAAALTLALLLAGIALLLGDQARASALSARQSASAAEQNAVSANSARLQAELQQRTATARELAAASIANLDVDPERSILLALQAVAATNKTDHVVMPEAEDALHRAVETSRIFRTFAGLEKPDFISFSPDETRIAVYCSGEIHFWDIASGKELITLPVPSGNVDRMQLNRDGTRLATTVINEDGTFPVATIFDLRTGAVLLKTLLSVPDYTYSDYSPDWSRIVVGSQDGTATLWDTATGKLLWTNAHSDTNVRDVAFSPDGKQIAAAFRDGTASVLDALTGKELLTLRGHTESVDSINYNADGTRIGTASSDATAKVWDASTGKELLDLTGHGDLATDIKFSHDGTRILTTSLTRGGIVWDGQSGQMLTKLPGHTGFVFYGAISANGSRVVTSSSSDGTVRVWDLQRSQEWLSVATTAPLSSQVFVAGTVVYSPDGTQFAVGLRDGRILIWNSTNGQVVMTLHGHTGPVHRIAYSPDGKGLASASSDGTARIWDVATGKQLTVIRASTGIVDSIAFSPDGKRVASGSYGHIVQIWDVDSGEQITTLDTSAVGPPRNPTDLVQNNTTWLAFSPDGEHLAASFGEGTVANWDLKRGKPLYVQRIGSGTWTLVFNPDGSRLAMSSIDVGAKVLDAATSNEIFALGGTVTPADHIAYSHDGTRLATAHIGEATAKVWDAATGKQLLTLYGDPSGVQSVDFSPDGARLALASNNDVRIYFLHIQDLVGLANTRVTRSLTTEECNKYLHLDSCPVE